MKHRIYRQTVFQPNSKAKYYNAFELHRTQVISLLYHSYYKKSAYCDPAVRLWFEVWRWQTFHKKQ